LLLTVIPFSLSVLATLNSYLTAGAERGTATSTSTRPGTTSASANLVRALVLRCSGSGTVAAFQVIRTIDRFSVRGVLLCPGT